MLQWKIFSSRWTAISWLVLITILFILPGSAIPRDNWFARIYLDKWVHVGFFAVLVFLWRSSLEWQGKSGYMILLLAFMYGLAIEYIQELWVPNRSFDMLDVMADLAGSVIGWLIWALGKKNKPL